MDPSSGHWQLTLPWQQTPCPGCHTRCWLPSGADGCKRWEGEELLRKAAAVRRWAKCCRKETEASRDSHGAGPRARVLCSSHTWVQCAAASCSQPMDTAITLVGSVLLSSAFSPITIFGVSDRTWTCTTTWYPGTPAGVVQTVQSSMQDRTEPRQPLHSCWEKRHLLISALQLQAL